MLPHASEHKLNTLYNLAVSYRNAEEKWQRYRIVADKRDMQKARRKLDQYLKELQQQKKQPQLFQ